MIQNIQSNITENASPDPVYAAIAEYDKAFIALGEVNYREPKPRSPGYEEWEKEFSPIMDAYSKALDVALSTTPVTREGALALINFAFRRWTEQRGASSYEQDDGMLVLESLRVAWPKLA